MRVLFEQNYLEAKAAADGEEALLSSIHLRHTCLERNQRCLLAYLYNRLTRIREMRWEIGSILPEDFRLSLCEEEIHWFQKYNQSLGAYMRSVGDGTLHLTLYTTPPKSLYIEVRCLMDYGELVTDDGTVVQLRKGSQHHLLRSQCEHLVRQGVLEHIQWRDNIIIIIVIYMLTFIMVFFFNLLMIKENFLFKQHYYYQCYCHWMVHHLYWVVVFHLLLYLLLTFLPQSHFLLSS